MTNETLESLLENSLALRVPLIDERHETALRLFNGFSEGAPNLVADLYGRTLVLHNYADKPDDGQADVRVAQAFFLTQLPWLQAVVVKTRHSQDAEARRGLFTFGTAHDRKIKENGIWYACSPCLNRDTSFYLDTRNVRAWAPQHLKDKTVLNTFAYTGSLGVAALAGGAARVVQLDLNRNFLNVAKTSYSLNGFPIHKSDFLTGDFFSLISRLKVANARFDCVFLDPPIYSATTKGLVDLKQSYTPLVNKVRPLINHDGHLVAINNALFYSGADFMREIETLCADGYLRIEKLIPVPTDFIGTQITPPPVDPAPFNHSTKIIVLRVQRKDFKA